MLPKGVYVFHPPWLLKFHYLETMYFLPGPGAKSRGHGVLSQRQRQALAREHFTVQRAIAPGPSRIIIRPITTIPMVARAIVILRTLPIIQSSH